MALSADAVLMFPYNRCRPLPSLFELIRSFHRLFEQALYETFVFTGGFTSLAQILVARYMEPDSRRKWPLQEKDFPIVVTVGTFSDGTDYFAREIGLERSSTALGRRRTACPGIF